MNIEGLQESLTTIYEERSPCLDDRKSFVINDDEFYLCYREQIFETIF